MKPDSLVFLLIVGMWAAFFVQHWVRRREHLATVHAADSFTETMRVLDRRPAPTAATPGRSSYAVPLSRTSRPQLTVEVPGQPAMATMSRAAGAGATGSSGSDGASDAGDSSAVDGPAARPSVSRPVPDLRPASGGTRIRQVVLVLAVLGVVATSVLGYLGTLPWLWAGVAGGVLVLSLGWTRRAARIEARRAARAAEQRRAAVRRVVREAAPVAAHAPAAAETEATELTAAAGSLSDGTGQGTDERAKTDAAQAPAAPAAEFVDPLAADTPAPAPVVEPEPEPVIEYDYKVLVDEDDIPLTWDPVPVPRPVYSMKAKAQRAEQAPAATTPSPDKTGEAADGEVRRPRNHESTAYAGQPKRSAHTA